MGGNTHTAQFLRFLAKYKLASERTVELKDSAGNVRTLSGVVREGADPLEAITSIVMQNGGFVHRIYDSRYGYGIGWIMLDDGFVITNDSGGGGQFYVDGKLPFLVEKEKVTWLNMANVVWRGGRKLTFQYDPYTQDMPDILGKKEKGAFCAGGNGENTEHIKVMDFNTYNPQTGQISWGSVVREGSAIEIGEEFRMQRMRFDASARPLELLRTDHSALLRLDVPVEEPLRRPEEEYQLQVEVETYPQHEILSGAASPAEALPEAFVPRQQNFRPEPPPEREMKQQKYGEGEKRYEREALTGRQPKSKGKEGGRPSGVPRSKAPTQEKVAAKGAGHVAEKGSVHFRGHFEKREGPPKLMKVPKQAEAGASREKPKRKTRKVGKSKVQRATGGRAAVKLKKKKAAAKRKGLESVKLQKGKDAVKNRKKTSKPLGPKVKLKAEKKRKEKRTGERAAEKKTNVGIGKKEKKAKREKTLEAAAPKPKTARKRKRKKSKVAITLILRKTRRRRGTLRLL